jgi:nucleotide-binding universal stress UspA family protein
VVNGLKILILIDGSLWSQKAAIHALPIAKRKKAEVVFFSVLDIRDAKAMAFNFCVQSDMCERIKDYEEQIWRDMKRSINDEIADIMFYYNTEDIPCSYQMVEGDTREKIVAEANSGAYDLVVMGAIGKNSKAKVGALVDLLPREIKPPLFIVR